MCGNTWASAEPAYVEADNISIVIKKLNLNVSAYRKNGKLISNMRTPKGQGYGTWEINPDFDLTEINDKTDYVQGVRCYVTKLNVQPIANFNELSFFYQK